MPTRTDETRTLIAKPIAVWVVAWACIIFFLFCAVMSWRANAGWPVVLFVGFVLFGIYLLKAGSVEMDAEHVTYRTLIGTYRIRWDEVSRIEIDAQGGDIVFFGQGKQLNTVGPAYWAGKDKMEMLSFMGSQMNQYGIEMVGTPKAMFRWTKNARVRD